MSAATPHHARIRALPIWRGDIDIAPVGGGMTNANYVVTDCDRAVVVRIGADIPVHGILRFNELAASRAAAEAGVSPMVIHAEPGALVVAKIEGRTYEPADLRADLPRVIELVKRAHREVRRRLRGPALAFDVFHVIGDYGRRLREEESRMAGDMPRFEAAALRLQAASGPYRPVFGHNDLLAGNFIADADRLWLIDWDYAGFASPLFDLAGLATNNGLDAGERRTLLETYFEAPLDDERERRFRAMCAASLLRETLWSLVSETHSGIAFDYAAYTRENLARFEAAWAHFLETELR